MKPNFVIIRGIPGAGKTTVASIIANKLNYSLLDPDLIDVESTKFIKFSNTQLDNIPDRKVKYRFLLDEAIINLKENRNIIWSQPWRITERINITIRNIYFYLTNDSSCWDLELSYLINKANFNIKIIELQIPSDKAMKRIQKRHRSGNHIWTGDSFDTYIKSFETLELPIDHLKINSSGKVNTVINKIVEYIKN